MKQTFRNILEDKDHPIWNMFTIVVVFGGAYILLRANATNFDATEYKSIGGLTALIAAWETARATLLGKRNKE